VGPPNLRVLLAIFDNADLSGESSRSGIWINKYSFVYELHSKKGKFTISYALPSHNSAAMVQ